MKVKIKLIFLGHLPHSINTEKILSWKSDLFQILPPINIHTITSESDGPNWDYSDENIESQLPLREEGDILIAMTNVRIQNNYFARRSTDNRICLTYYEMSDYLKADNIPLENLIFRVLYSVSFVYKRYGNRLPGINEHTNFTHDETKGCIFDMNGNKADIIYSVNRPYICESCVQSLTNSKIEKNLIDKVQRELKKIKKGLYYRITDLIKKYPIAAIIISSIWAILLGTVGSIIAAIIWKKFF